MYTIILAAIAALAVAAPSSTAPVKRADNSLPPLPADVADGFYASTVNADGSQSWEFQGPVTANVTRRLVARDSGVKCANTGIGPDAEMAAEQLTEHCGNGYSWGGRSISVSYGNAVAYGCNYGNGQVCHAFDLEGFYDAIFGNCGAGSAGWYSKYDEWKATYGVVSAGTGFC